MAASAASALRDRRRGHRSARAATTQVAAIKDAVMSTEDKALTSVMAAA
jgi:hypothetical protein